MEADLRTERTGFNVREAQMQKVPYMLVLGDKEAESGTVSPRSRDTGDLGSVGLAREGRPLAGGP